MSPGRSVGSSCAASTTTSAPGLNQPSRPSSASAGAARPERQGGSSHAISKAAGAGPGEAASRTSTVPSPPTLRRSRASAAGSRSMKPARAAPRESASSPTAPVPAKTSRKAAPSSGGSSPAWTKRLNAASRTRSAVGRTDRSAGTASRRPRQRPPTMRITTPARPGAGREVPLRPCKGAAFRKARWSRENRQFGPTGPIAECAAVIYGRY